MVDHEEVERDEAELDRLRHVVAGLPKDTDAVLDRDQVTALLVVLSDVIAERDRLSAELVALGYG